LQPCGLSARQIERTRTNPCMVPTLTMRSIDQENDPIRRLPRLRRRKTSGGLHASDTRQPSERLPSASSAC
jgi:hypothetical protein